MKLGIAPRAYARPSEPLHWNLIAQQVLAAERIGLEFAITTTAAPVVIDSGRRMESLGIAHAMALVTSSILCIGTLNPLLGPAHPRSVAERLATMEAMAPGRIGINVVSGGLGAQERHLYGQPEPESRHAELDRWLRAFTGILPPTMIQLCMAGESEATAAMARHYCVDMAFTVPGVRMGMWAGIPTVFSTARVLFRHTPALVQAELQLMLGPDIPHYQDAPEGHRYGIGSTVELIGTPPEVALKMVRLREQGFTGMALQFASAGEIAMFGQHILPLYRSLA